MFKIICAGWNCAPFITETLDSIDIQGRRDFEVMISYESENPKDEGFQIITDWIKSRREPKHYKTSFRKRKRNFLYGTEARYRGIEKMKPADDDVIIWLNVDGDRFAHRQVLDRVWDAYFIDDFPLVTYGSFACVPPIAAPLIAMPYDNATIANRSYRQAPFRAADLRTMKYKVFREIPIDQFQWSTPERAGEWYSKVDDLTSMIPALELVGIRHRFIPEVLMTYNTWNPLSGSRIAPDEAHACDTDFRAKPPLDLVF